MGVITEISSQKNKTRVNLFIDNSFFCGLMTETLVKNNLKVGMVVDEDKLKEIIFESEMRKGLNYVFSLVAKKAYTRFEIAKKLKDKGYDDKVIDAINAKLAEYNLVNDEEFARASVGQMGLLSRRQLEQKLKQKGINDAIIKSAVNDIKSGDEEGKIAIISAKYLKNKPKTQENLQRLFRYLAGKGFEFDLIKKQISQIKVEENEGEGFDENWD